MKTFKERAKEVTKMTSDLRDEMNNVLVGICKEQGLRYGNSFRVYCEPVNASKIGLASKGKIVVGIEYGIYEDPFLCCEGMEKKMTIQVIVREPDATLDSYRKRQWYECIKAIHITRLASFTEYMANSKMFTSCQSIEGIKYWDNRGKEYVVPKELA